MSPMQRRNYIKLIPIFIIYVVIFRFLYVDNGFNVLVDLFIPILAGVFIAVVLNPILIFAETKLNIKSRILSITFTFSLFVLALALLFVTVIPGIVASLVDFIEDPQLLTSINKYVNEISELLTEIGAGEFTDIIENTIQDGIQYVYSLGSTVINTAIAGTFGLLSALMTFFIAIIISIYVLYDKEHFENFFYKTTHGLFEKRYADEIVKLGYNLYTNMTRFISGKLLDSLIIGILAYLGARYLIDAPYPSIIGVIIGVTNMIPYFGPFIGGIPAVLITLLYDPVEGLWMALLVLAIQQFDGWYLGPKILGNSLDLRPVWIVISILIGGGLFGPVGMFLATPFAALIKTFMEGYFAIKLGNITLPHEEEHQK